MHIKLLDSRKPTIVYMLDLFYFPKHNTIGLF